MEDFLHKMAVYCTGFEPQVFNPPCSYLAEFEVTSVPNTTINNGKAYTPSIRIFKMEPLQDPLALEGGREMVKQWYKDIHNMPYK